jgi:hypothetical protein
MEGVTKQLLGGDVVAAIAQAKTDLRFNRLRRHQGDMLIDPHLGKRGAELYEANVGEARAADPLGKAGKRRLVLKVQSGQITEMYFSDDHYRVGSWRRILDF